jgi:general stress protein YciG
MAETRNRGFASMDREKQRAIASKGGKAAHQQGTAHEFTPDEAREAGRKGGERVSRNREHMSHIGRLGGEASRNSRNLQAMAGSTNKTHENGHGNGNGNGTAAQVDMTPEYESPVNGIGETGMGEL